MLIALMVSEFCNVQGALPSTPLDVEKELFSFKEANEQIQKKIIDLDVLLKDRDWSTVKIKEIFKKYEDVQGLIDAFPLYFKENLKYLHDIEKDYSDEETLSEVVKKYINLHRETPLAYTNDIIEILKDAYQLFYDVEVFVRNRCGFISSNFHKLSSYQEISLPGFTELEAYLQKTAKKLLKEVSDVFSTFSITEKTVPLKVKRGQDTTGKITEIREGLEWLNKQDQRLIKLIEYIDMRMRSELLTKSDLEIFNQFYQDLYSVSAINDVKKKEVDVLPLCCFDDAGFYAEKIKFYKNYQLLQESLRRFRRQGFADLKFVQEVFNSSAECVQAYLEQNDGFCSLVRNIMFSPNRIDLDSEESIQDLVQLLLWNGPLFVVQDAVRRRAFEMLEQIQAIISLDSIDWVIKTMIKFRDLEQELSKSKLNLVSQEKLAELQEKLAKLRGNVQKVQTPFIRFKDELCMSIDKLVQGAVL